MQIQNMSVFKYNISLEITEVVFLCFFSFVYYVVDKANKLKMCKIKHILSILAVCDNTWIK